MILGVDIGGSHIGAGLLRGCSTIRKASVEADKRDAACFFNSVVAAIRRVFNSRVTAIGVGCPGPLDWNKGVIVAPRNLPLRNFMLRERLESIFKVRVAVDNDASCAVLAEAVYGAGKGKAVVAGLTLGTGVGGGLVIKSEVYHGAGNASEFGHTSIGYNGRRCNCGSRGCIEEYASSRGIVRTAKSHGLRVESPKELYRLALKGNKKAVGVFRETGFYLGVAVANIINCLSPDIIVVGGKVSGSWRFFHKSLKEAAYSRSFSKPPIVKAELVDAGILGSGLIACRRG
ncbi:TPA: ROK family protein [Candidatus Woesearchaeota archaeon]|nr:ROK family protein [Candidatus Woesearchaeota archaeon]